MYNGGLYKNDGVYNGIAYKSKTVYKESNGGGGNVVNIGGVDYEYIQLGNFYIITQNLRYHTSFFHYPNNDPSKENEMGLLYGAYYMFNEIIPILPDGWKVPSISEWAYLRDNISANSNDYISTDDGGNNVLQTNFRLCGYINSSGIVTGYGNKALLWSSSPYDSNRTKNIDVTKNSILDITDMSNGSATSNANTSLSVRVIKDL